MADVHIWQSVDGDPLNAASWSTGTVPGTLATGTLTLTGQPLDTETVTIDARTYTFQTVLTDVNGNVLIGATASDSLDNLIAAITLGAGAGTTYAASTTLHATATAVAGAGDTMDVTAKVVGTHGNTLATTETLTSGSFGGGTLSGAVTNWAVDDQVEFNGAASQVSMVTSVDWTGIDVDAIVSDRTFRGDLGTDGAPIKVACNRLTINGDGAAHFTGAHSTAMIDRVVVNSRNGRDALMIGGRVGPRLIVTSGHMIVGGDAGFPGLDHVERVIADGGNARATINTGSVVRIEHLIVEGGAWVKNYRYLENSNNGTFVVGVGYFEQSGNSYGVNLHVGAGGTAVLDPFVVLSQAEQLYVASGGTLDMSGYHSSCAAVVVVSPGGRFIPPTNGIGALGDVIFLREEFP